MIWKINLSTSTEERKEKEAGSGGWRVKGEVSSHWGVRALLREGVSRSGGGVSGRPGEAAPHRGRGGCRGHREMPKGFRTRRHESGVRMKG